MAHKQLGEHERFVIELMLSKNNSSSEIARFLGCSRQTVSREIKRNGDRHGVYNAVRAQNMAVVRKEYPNQDSKLKKLSSPRSNKSKTLVPYTFRSLS